MRNMLKHYWDTLMSSLWFVPSIMTVLALIIAFAAIRIDTVLDSQTAWAYGGGPEGARELLATIAGSMITVAGVSFSVMIVALTLASQQFGPRLLRNFMRDTSNQIVLGTFIATFTYCLLVLRTIRAGSSEFVPHVSVTLAIFFALASLGVLIYFIHHAAVSIQAPELLAMVAKDVENGIERLFPEKIGRNPEDEAGWSSADSLSREFEFESTAVTADESGYLQSVDDESLMKVARENDLVLLIKPRPGDFIICGEDLARTRPSREDDRSLTDGIRSAFILGTQRTHLQDIEFSIRQLVEVAVRALSPGINDPFTAVNAIDHITVALSRLAERSFPSPLRYDEQRNLRVIARPVGFEEIVKAAFDPIRQYGRSSQPVILRLLGAIAVVARHAQRQSDCQALLHQAKTIAASSLTEFTPADRRKIEEALESALAALRPNRCEYQSVQPLDQRAQGQTARIEKSS